MEKKIKMAVQRYELEMLVDDEDDHEVRDDLVHDELELIHL